VGRESLKKDEIDELVDEYLAVAPFNAEAELRLVDAALFLEDCLGVRVRDGDFSQEKLGGAAALRAFAQERALALGRTGS
jgi:hypothetical protein